MAGLSFSCYRHNISQGMAVFIMLVRSSLISRFHVCFEINLPLVRTQISEWLHNFTRFRALLFSDGFNFQLNPFCMQNTMCRCLALQHRLVYVSRYKRFLHYAALPLGFAQCGIWTSRIFTIFLCRVKVSNNLSLYVPTQFFLDVIQKVLR